MATVCLCMIVINEEEVLSRCLESICDLVDEIVIVDTGSEDLTVEIAGKYRNASSFSHGRMIFLRQEIMRWIRLKWNTVCGWMQMIFSQGNGQMNSGN